MSANDLVILFGSASSERRVSAASAQHISAILPAAEPLFLAPAGQVHRIAPAALQAHARPFETDFVPAGAPDYPSLAAALDAPGSQGRVWILALHGGEGEDGTIQRALELRGIAFTGPGSTASAHAFDKAIAKRIVSTAGVRIAPAQILPQRDAAAAEAAMTAFLAEHGQAVAKPLAGGSSVGLHHLMRPADIPGAAQDVARAADVYLVEAFVRGTELTVGVVDGEHGPRALPASEIRLDPGRSFDFEGKYLGKGTTEITPAEVPPELFHAAQDLALRAHRALGCEGYSRTDLILGPQGAVFLETNTLPGLTRASFIPQQLAAEGTTMAAFLAGQIALACRRRDRDRGRTPRAP